MGLSSEGLLSGVGEETCSGIGLAVSVPGSGVLVDGAPDTRRRLIAGIVLAVDRADHGRLSVLLERFAVEADMSALFALREALSRAAARRRAW
ncbi:hypothetical protein [Streptomyces violascens]|uniref:hypothetical protein n=1 Tax=Streptomyces violascens TaxID=67381 RepID=UPI003659BE88